MDSAVVPHLIARLDGDAKELWSDDSFAIRLSSTGTTGKVHDALHRHLGAIGRRLRSARPGLPIHAASCTLGDGLGVLLPGNTGVGKSTLCLALGLERDAYVVSDDTVWLGSGEVVGFGSPFAIRNTSPYFELSQKLWYADRSSRLLVQPDDLGAPRPRSDAVINVCVFAEHGVGPSGARIVSPAEAFCRLSGSLLRAPSHEELEAVATLVTAVPCFAIAYPNTSTALRFVDEITEAPPVKAHVLPQILDEGHLRAAGMGPAVGGIRFGPDIVLWNAAGGSMVYITGWTGERPPPTSIIRQLREAKVLETGV